MHMYMVLDSQFSSVIIRTIKPLDSLRELHDNPVQIMMQLPIVPILDSNRDSNIELT